MSTITESIATTLNALIRICKDGEEGYTDAAKHAKNGELISLFKEYATQRSQFATELQNLVQIYGGEPPEESDLASAFHRGWIDFKSMITGHSDHAILAECEHGEDVAVHAYRDALADGDLPAGVASLVQDQFAYIQSAHDRIKTLRDLADQK